MPLAAIGLALMAAAGLNRKAQAQHTPDPYNIVGEYNVGYENYMYATYPNAAGFTPNQGILQGRATVGRANQFQSYLDSVMGFGSSAEDFGFGNARGGGTFGQPGWRAHHQYDEQFDRIYTPNAGPDQSFRADQEARTKLYIDYLKEPDPKKRAQLFRAYNQQSLRMARETGGGTARAGSRVRTPSSTSTSPLPPVGGGRSPASSLLLPGAPSSRPSALRGSSGAPPAAGRSRSSLTSPARSETAEEILERATRPIAPSGGLSAPSGPSSSPR
jgi:hypothetical protein